ncbi:4a-hydroxytetrahydrobiopterin dehydratase [Mesorhizobium sp. RP14(2022)]|uniref:Putative pterin-4-alpha-carbinolamine dehydratase n=1 Tax=Mesorhizobium liriopis TaxID=2953882 RepID=A0ABT1C4F6_9HYPH|nr:4a-hydroxytetrahydrobiopterin dehydratase [Mesorhizobium liriopis]MCO6048831.1 4a-hydroxytetrahydrobiopterin dehydratase [Mesorhizobium liriopis]
MPREPMDAVAVSAALAETQGWALSADGKSITRTFRFPSFGDAFAFMTRTALEAEDIDHHPGWFNSFRTVEVTLSTHVAKGLTALDFRLAQAMNRFAHEGDAAS